MSLGHFLGEDPLLADAWFARGVWRIDVAMRMIDASGMTFHDSSPGRRHHPYPLPSKYAKTNISSPHINGTKRSSTRCMTLLCIAQEAAVSRHHVRWETMARTKAYLIGQAPLSYTLLLSKLLRSRNISGRSFCTLSPVLTVSP